MGGRERYKNKKSSYKYLIVVEGKTDVKTYKELLIFYGINEDDFNIISAGGCGKVCDTKKWKEIKASNMSLDKKVNEDIVRKEFEKIILVIDTDDKIDDKFEYRKSENVKSDNTIRNPKVKLKDGYWLLDIYDGSKKIPVYGVKTPYLKEGCLESDLLKAYGYPEGEAYDNLEKIIKKSSEVWNIPKEENEKNWWEINCRARMDKYIYSALSYGFKISNPKRYDDNIWKIPKPKEEPEVIKTIRKIFDVKFQLNT
ncbi:MAG: hypothetical protein LBL93_05050 [Ruminococcus sp.]|jgi:hypothetical protein|nr:hypothetical protein [Ruminococcus sp.]